MNKGIIWDREIQKYNLSYWQRDKVQEIMWPTINQVTIKEMKKQIKKLAMSPQIKKYKLPGSAGGFDSIFE